MLLYLPIKHVILGIETSCDETSAAVLDHGNLSSIVTSSQFFHSNFGGVVPELASRTHLRTINTIVQRSITDAGIALSDLTAIAVTYAPGLMGSLLVGLNYAKGLSLGLGIPIIGIHHLEAHIFSAILEEHRPQLPFIALVVSGGHTLLVKVNDIGDYETLGETLDDAAGEAFDKVGKMLHMPYPAGPTIDSLAKKGNAKAIRFPRAMMDEDNFDFSFSGIKTSVLYWLQKHPGLDESTRLDLIASFQRAMVDVLVSKTMRAAIHYGIDDIVCVGGVSANSELRATFHHRATLEGKRFYSPRPLFSTDNAAMIAALGALKLEKNITNDLSLTALPRVPLSNSISNA